ncbi:MAG TPA: hypothetical protein VFZ77_22440 [Acidimicrobiales bacterium]
MDARTRRLAGWVVVAVGVVVAIVGGFADQLGLGGEGPDKFGPQQVAAVAVGVGLVAVGLVVALWPDRSEPAAGQPPDRSGVAGAEPPP